MKRFLLLGSLILPAIFLTNCKKEQNTELDNSELAPNELAEIRNAGFGTDGARKVSEGYLVEGDIILTAENLQVKPSSPNMTIAQEEQYRTFNLVNTTNYPVIKVALNNSSSTHQSVFSAALDEAIIRYNAENLKFKMQRVTSGAHITVVAYYEVSNTLGSAGFPSNSGSPYSQVKMNTYHYSTSTSSTNTNYIATIMSHELGHCVGFRHTDYMNRAYSCGSGGNEGQSTTGVGAVHIPGTPTGPDAKSWMLACIGSGVNRPFNANDKVALSYVY